MLPKHPKKIEGIEFDALAKQLGNLSYDALATFLFHLSDELYLQYRADMAKNRDKLANTLLEAVKNIEAARYNIEAAWKICDPYMEKALQPKQNG
jgi:hypothetical protein